MSDILTKKLKYLEKIQAGAELSQAQHRLGFDSTLILYRFGFYRSSKKIEEKNNPMVPPVDHFQGENENCSALARMISTLIRSFFCKVDHF